MSKKCLELLTNCDRNKSSHQLFTPGFFNLQTNNIERDSYNVNLKEC